MVVKRNKMCFDEFPNFCTPSWGAKKTGEDDKMVRDRRGEVHRHGEGAIRVGKKKEWGEGVGMGVCARILLFGWAKGKLKQRLVGSKQTWSKNCEGGDRKGRVGVVREK